MRDAIEIAVELAKEFEGLHKQKPDGRIYPYFCPAGYVTIGYGHLLASDKRAKLTDYPSITKADAVELLKKDVANTVYQATQSSWVLNRKENTFRLAAIADFIFNLGIGSYNTSTLKKAVDKQDWVEAQKQINRWVYATVEGQTKKLNGLVRRRAREADLLTRDWTGSLV